MNTTFQECLTQSEGEHNSFERFCFFTIIESFCSFILILRLGLERGGSAEEALLTIIELLERYGQGGPCSDTDPTLTYHNSYLIADRKESWVLETVGNVWAAEKIESKT